MKQNVEKKNDKRFRVQQYIGEFLDGVDYVIYMWILLLLLFVTLLAVGCINGEIGMEQLTRTGMISHSLFAVIAMIILFHVFFHSLENSLCRTLGLFTGHALGFIILCMHEKQLFLVSVGGVTIIHVICYYSVMRIFVWLIKRILRYIARKQKGTCFRAFCSVEDVVYDITFNIRDDKKYHISDIKEVEHAKRKPPTEPEDVVLQK